jgi:hypothetical protein
MLDPVGDAIIHSDHLTIPPFLPSSAVPAGSSSWPFAVPLTVADGTRHVANTFLEFGKE